MLQDAHIHLQDCGRRAEEILHAARERGVGRFFVNATSPYDWSEVRDLSERYRGVVPFFGVHPWYIDRVRDGWEEKLKRFLKLPGSCVGEIGLDGARTDIDFGLQQVVFTRQLDIAMKLRKPFAVHCVQAWDTLLYELRKRSGSLPTFTLHWFSGSPEVALELTKLGGYISVSTRLLYERAIKQRASFDATPADRLLLETDYPYTPDKAEGPGEDAAKYFEWLTALYGMAAKRKEMDDKTFAKRIWDNGTVLLR